MYDDSSKILSVLIGISSMLIVPSMSRQFEDLFNDYKRINKQMNKPKQNNKVETESAPAESKQ